MQARQRLGARHALHRHTNWVGEATGLWPGLALRAISGQQRTNAGHAERAIGSGKVSSAILAIEFHVVIRLDRAMPRYRRDVVRAPDGRFAVQLLEDALRDAAAAVTVPVPAKVG